MLGPWRSARGVGKPALGRRVVHEVAVAPGDGHRHVDGAEPRRAALGRHRDQAGADRREQRAPRARWWWAHQQVGAAARVPCTPASSSCAACGRLPVTRAVARPSLSWSTHGADGAGAGGTQRTVTPPKSRARPRPPRPGCPFPPSQPPPLCSAAGSGCETTSAAHVVVAEQAGDRRRAGPVGGRQHHCVEVAVERRQHAAQRGQQRGAVRAAVDERRARHPGARTSTATPLPTSSTVMRRSARCVDAATAAVTQAAHAGRDRRRQRRAAAGRPRAVWPSHTTPPAPSRGQLDRASTAPARAAGGPQQQGSAAAPWATARTPPHSTARSRSGQPAERRRDSRASRAPAPAHDDDQGEQRQHRARWRTAHQRQHPEGAGGHRRGGQLRGDGDRERLGQQARAGQAGGDGRRRGEGCRRCPGRRAGSRRRWPRAGSTASRSAAAQRRAARRNAGGGRHG